MDKQQERVESSQSDLETYLHCFGHNVSILCEQESDCQISSEDAYFHIRSLWLELKNSQPEIVTHLEQPNGS